MRFFRRAAPWFAAGIGLLSSGCAMMRPKDPAATAQRYLELMAGERPDAAYPLLGAAFVAHCDRTCFSRLAAGQREDARRALTDLRAGGELRADYAVEIALTDGTMLHLRQAEEGEIERPLPAAGKRQKAAAAAPRRYLLTQTPLDFYPQSTPEEALRSFVRALAAKRYAALLRFVPGALAEQLTEEQIRLRFDGPARPSVQAQLAVVQKHWDEPFQVDGATARLPLGEGQEVRLVLEQGRWRVAQLQ